MFAATSDFVPDLLFRGSSLSGWHTVGAADWRATNGAISGTPRGGSGGWLVLDKSYQDVEFYAEFRCTGPCDAGVLLRAEKSRDGGLKGVYVSLKEGDVEPYDASVGPEGKILSRARLERATVQFARIATGAWTNGQAHVPGFSKLAPTLAEQQAEAAARPAPAAPPAGGRGAPPAPALQPDAWNTVEMIVDADMVWITANGRRLLPPAATTDRMMGYGPIALHVEGTGSVKFREVSVKDLNRKIEPAEQISAHFRLQRLDDFFYSWGSTAGDINRDCVPDVVAGPFYFLGPDYTERHEFTSARTYSPRNNFPQGMVYFSYDYTGDGWDDIVVVDSRPVYLYVNPRGESRRWDRYAVVPDATSEIELFRDIDGDDRPDVVFTGPGAVMSYAAPDRANPTAPWKVHKISQPGLAAPHGMGAGDINGDGRIDLVNSRGWWEQPAGAAAGAAWTFHPESFGTGGAEMGVYDVNGDGRSDVVTAIAAHGWGLAWFEQKRDSRGAISFVRHDIMGDSEHEERRRRGVLRAARRSLRRHGR